jgi:hypothetical protein
MKKSQNMPVDSAKWFCPSIFLHSLLRLETAQQSETPAKERVQTDMI